ncbi:hypothetical protein DPMN_179682 [Dreissena polymorpha]|uniref:Uncharacterized protein n=1 Tax=Dreissena polymorpha TaxID=45954 RepID=A0A9D4ED91_DREPO|nr:hypothetical protein DPMN_179682 [Dreissena polymorpha]
MGAEELYLYGGMDTYASKSVLSRNDISGHFANIYKAKYKGKTVDEFLMKAKMNFSSEKNGTLKEYLVQHKSNVTMEIQETLFRIGRDIAMGMEYLAGKGKVRSRDLLDRLKKNVRVQAKPKRLRCIKKEQKYLRHNGLLILLDSYGDQ